MNDTDILNASSESLAALAMHFALYPLMTPQDAVKLLYQSEFGCGHFAPSPERAREMLERECAGLEKDETHAKTEPIGGGFVRVHLEPLVGDKSALNALATAFVRSAESPCGSMDGFKLRLDALKSMAESGKAPFSAQELAGFMAEYDKLGRPAVHHSEVYRKNYHPAYRVIKSELA
ncbi:MAG: hypothetical protein IKI64_09955 [Clostridia bacterium]|nr:hypothetical protein [Clostridia bacterium]